ncbi:CRISPR-associated protein Cas7 [Pontibacter sp. G13]|uniref:CRISPR-associated protein Cas7 n=1 Tax=Pontibacter sp. G13 TaxID=3074898 RepID=UPI00288A6751|nr:CRISPR-associated protein Cas7 [Pontibacter sp. G13]WNJ20035.1 CRISPR-associated protein Cas7 [Pontibacter sp. G13]
MNTIYIRTLKRADHTVFGVEKGQKTYYDPQFGRMIPYSSGQQIKRSILESLNLALETAGSPTTFFFDVTKKEEIKEGEVFGTCNPADPDQLLGGWMRAASGGKEKTLKRRSPLSISSMRGLHPLLAGTNKENMTFDRSNRPNNVVVVRDQKGNELSTEEIKDLLSGKDRSLERKWIADQTRATGLFVQDIAIDMRRLFSVALNPFEPEISAEVEASLREAGWIESESVFGPCLVAPKSVRDTLIPALVDSIFHWRITSNQSRTLSLMETLAVGISDNANKIAGSIRAKLTEAEKAMPIVEEELEGVDMFVTLPAAGYLITKNESADALENAREHLIGLLNKYDYEGQPVMA